MSDEQEAIPDLHFWRYDTPTGMCDHPITLTNRATLWAGSWQATTTEVVTVCLDCDQIFQLEDANRPTGGCMSEDFETRCQTARLRKGEVLAALAAVTDPTLRALIDHHSQQGQEDYFERTRCVGCDQGCSCDRAAWPCSTIVLICEGIGVDMTDMDGDMNLARWGDET